MVLNRFQLSKSVLQIPNLNMNSDMQVGPD